MKSKLADPRTSSMAVHGWSKGPKGSVASFPGSGCCRCKQTRLDHVLDHDILIKMPFTVAHVQRSNYKIAVRDRFRASKVDAVLKVRLCRHIWLHHVTKALHLWQIFSYFATSRNVRAKLFVLYLHNLARTESPILMIVVTYKQF